MILVFIGILSIVLMTFGLALIAFCVIEQEHDWLLAFGAFMVAVSAWIMVCH